jgi:hypothetical protein
MHQNWEALQQLAAKHNQPCNAPHHVNTARHHALGLLFMPDPAAAAAVADLASFPALSTILLLLPHCCVLSVAAAAVADLASFLALRAAEFALGGLLALTFIGSGGDDDVDAHPYLR